MLLSALKAGFLRFYKSVLSGTPMISCPSNQICVCNIVFVSCAHKPVYPCSDLSELKLLSLVYNYVLLYFQQYNRGLSQCFRSMPGVRHRKLRARLLARLYPVLVTVKASTRLTRTQTVVANLLLCSGQR